MTLTNRCVDGFEHHFQVSMMEIRLKEVACIVPIGLAASGNLLCIIAFPSFQSLVHESCPKSKMQVTPNPPKGGSKATSEGDWIKVHKKGKGKDVIDNRVSDLPVSS
ncbi:hypothetical protein Tco_1120751 [Tanacetum coccineum]